MIAVIDAQLAWWPPTFSPSSLSRRWLALWIVQADSQRRRSSSKRSASMPAPAGSADLVLTFRNLHNWMMLGWERQALEAMHAALKPGGILGIVEHRGDPDVPQDPKALSGYVNEQYAIELIEGAGFELIERAEINANPKDLKNYEQGVWALPPTFAAGEENRQRYSQIGESDRFTLKFRKVAK